MIFPNFIFKFYHKFKLSKHALKLEYVGTFGTPHYLRRWRSTSHCGKSALSSLTTQYS